MYEGTRTFGRLFVMLLISMGWLHRIRNQVSAAKLAGVVAGVIGIIISFMGRGLTPGRVLGDPLPLVLTIQHLIGGSFLYLNWRGFLMPLLFLAFMAILTTILLAFLRSNQSWEVDDARGAGRLAAGVVVGITAVIQVDAIVVAFWYLLAGVVAVFLTGFMAGQIARIFLKFR
ncbi:MAG: hypothetical protein GWP61_28605 [Chloroflexi bacterium]|jgi:energy-converting hydrogenase Eha subunit E|nr:hypothetical protein [Chloroflexota bacterium]